jgi:hypothetical protein
LRVGSQKKGVAIVTADFLTIFFSKIVAGGKSKTIYRHVTLSFLTQPEEEPFFWSIIFFFPPFTFHSCLLSPEVPRQVEFMLFLFIYFGFTLIMHWFFFSFFFFLLDQEYVQMLQ